MRVVTFHRFRSLTLLQYKCKYNRINIHLDIVPAKEDWFLKKLVAPKVMIYQAMMTVHAISGLALTSLAPKSFDHKCTSKKGAIVALNIIEVGLF